MKTAESLEKSDVVVISANKFRDSVDYDRLYEVIAHDAINQKIALRLIGMRDYPHDKRYLQMGYSQLDRRGQYVGKRNKWPLRIFKPYK